MIDRDHELSVTKQAEVVGIARGTAYYLPRPVPAADLALMQRIDRLLTEFPFAGARMLRCLLAANGSKVGRRHVKTLMSRMGWVAVVAHALRDLSALSCRGLSPASSHRRAPALVERWIPATRAGRTG